MNFYKLNMLMLPSFIFQIEGYGDWYGERSLCRYTGETADTRDKEVFAEFQVILTCVRVYSFNHVAPRYCKGPRVMWCEFICLVRYAMNNCINIEREREGLF